VIVAGTDPRALPAGERLLRCLLGEPVDRVPFGVGIGWVPWGTATERWRRESGMAALNPAQHFGYEEGFERVPAEQGIFPRFCEEVLAEDETTITRRTAFGIVKRDLKIGASMAEWLDYPVHTPAEWEQLKVERLRADEPGRVNIDWSLWKVLDAAGAAIQVGAFPFGPFGTVRDLLGVETMLVWFYDHPDVIRDMMRHLTSLWLSVYEEIARHVQIDHIHIWEDMSGKQGSLISPAMVEEFMMPCYDRMAAFAKRHGVRLVSVDSDGRCDELVKVMTRHGVNLFFPFEVQAGNDIRAYRRRYPELGILGGLDKNALARDRAAIDAEVEKARWMIENGERYIPGFDHHIPDNVSWENMRYAAERLRALCHGEA
jgi:uroporphyrinogen-III decarboxylase